MIQIRRAEDRGAADYGWLQARYTFSFADYRDREHMGFRSLRVMNEDRIAPGQGFGTHPHSDMEILTYVLEGALEHKDSMGNGEVIQAGEFQVMSAGSGVTHSEFNPSETESTHLYQIWIRPEEKGIAPRYEQKHFDRDQKNEFYLVASPDGADGSLRIHQDARVYLLDLEKDARAEYEILSGRHVWLQVLRGSAELAKEHLRAGDALSTSEPMLLALQGAENTELLLFDLA